MEAVIAVDNTCDRCTCDSKTLSPMLSYPHTFGYIMYISDNMILHIPWPLANKQHQMRNIRNLLVIVDR